MPEREKRSWKSKQDSFDNPQIEKKKNSGCEPSSMGILTILGQNIGLLTRKKSEETKKKYERETHSPKSKVNNKSGMKKIEKILTFPKSKLNQVNSLTKPEEDQKQEKKTIDVSIRKKSETKSTGNQKRNFLPKKKIRKRSSETSEIKHSNNSSKYGITETANVNKNKSVLIKKSINSTLKKSKSDSALNKTQKKSVRATSAQSNVSRGSNSTSVASKPGSAIKSKENNSVNSANKTKKSAQPEIKNQKVEVVNQTPLYFDYTNQVTYYLKATFFYEIYFRAAAW